MRIMMKSKIHRATVTQADLDYVGSVTLDAALMEAADLLEGEQVAIVASTTPRPLMENGMTVAMPAAAAISAACAKETGAARRRASISSARAPFFMRR